mmetsp:Transcript_12244/g.17406  ORF Transcript_12244/g.17406 Transcript_12244/m.17406 type:complete len:184 (-) Transcript_12244:171-722(-)
MLVLLSWFIFGMHIASRGESSTDNRWWVRNRLRNNTSTLASGMCRSHHLRSKRILPSIGISHFQTHKPVHYQVCDVRNPNDCKNAIESCAQTFGKLDILINAAAGNFLVEASALKPKGFQTVMEIDTMGTYNMCHYAHKHLKRSIAVVKANAMNNVFLLQMAGVCLSCQYFQWYRWQHLCSHL